MYALYTHAKGKLKIVGYQKEPTHIKGISIVKIQNKEVFESKIKHGNIEVKKPQELLNKKGWDVKRLGKNDFEKLKEYYDKENWGEAFKLHNNLKLSQEKYCCTRHIVKLKKGLEDYADYIRKRN